MKFNIDTAESIGLMMIGGITAMFIAFAGFVFAQVATTTATTTPSTQAVTCTLSATPSSIQTGGVVTLSWTSTNASTVSITPTPVAGSPTTPASGSLTVLPSASTVYRATFMGATGTEEVCETLVIVNGALPTGQATTTATTTPGTPPLFPVPTPTTTPPSVTPTTTPTTSTTTPQQPVILPAPDPAFTPAPPVIDINSDGSVLIRGVVNSIGTNAITIHTWGGTWTIRTTQNISRVIPSGPAGLYDLSEIEIGDFVGARGFMSQSATFTVEAQLVRNWTTNPYPGATFGAPRNSGSAGTNTQQSTSDATSTTSAPPTTEENENTATTTDDEPGFFQRIFN